MNFIVKYLVPFAALFFLFGYNIWLGILSMVCFISYQVYNNIWYFYSREGLKKYHQRDFTAAAEFFKKAHNTKRAPINTSISYAYISLKAGDVETAEKTLKKLYSGRLTPDEKLKLKSNEALVVWKKGDLNQAVEMLQEVMQEFKNTILYGSLGYLVVLQGDPDAAVAFNTEAYQYNSEDNTILDNLGQSYYLAKDYENSLKIYEELIERNPDFPEAYYNYGLTLEALGKKSQALHNIKKSREYSLNHLSGLTKDEIESKIQLLEKEETV